MKRFLLFLIRFYRRAISPYRPPCCRFIPTCSQYALEAIEKYGAVKGGWLAFKRIMRCHPFYKGGKIYDPVPCPNLKPRRKPKNVNHRLLHLRSLRLGPAHLL